MNRGGEVVKGEQSPCQLRRQSRGDAAHLPTRGPLRKAPHKGAFSF